MDKDTLDSKGREIKMVNRIQVNRNIVNVEILKEVKNHLIAPWQRNLLFITSVVAVGLGISNFMIQKTLQGVVLLILGIGCFAEIYYLNHRKYKETVKTIKDQLNKEEVTYTMSFGNDGVAIHNCDTGVNNKIPYANIKQIIETENTYTLLAKKQEFIVVRKDCLKVSVEDFVQFLKSKDTKIKRWVK